jgi:hypothetical protein
MCVVKLHDLQNPAIAPPPSVQTKMQTASLSVMLVMQKVMTNMTNNMAAPAALVITPAHCVALV